MINFKVVQFENIINNVLKRVLQMSDDNAANNLVGLTLNNIWFIKEKVQRGDNDTGSFFSIGYIAEKEGKEYFLKAYNLARFFSMNNQASVVDAMLEMSTAYKYERDLSEHCKNKHVTKVSFVQGYGEENISGYIYGVVPYLVFDLAEGDIRKTLSYSKSLDYAWRFKSLHDIAVGIKQLHKVKVSHQDLKPSNILVFSKESKLGDLGRSVCEDIHGPYSRLVYTGDLTYAPPEIMYKYYDNDLQRRAYALDCYMLGSLITFYFAGITMNALLMQHIPNEFSINNWKGDDYKILAPYIKNAFNDALSEFLNNIEKEKYKKDLLFLVSNLCNPIPEERGHPKNILSKTEKNHDLQRFISKLDLLKHKAEIDVQRFE